MATDATTLSKYPLAMGFTLILEPHSYPSSSRYVPLRLAIKSHIDVATFGKLASEPLEESQKTVVEEATDRVAGTSAETVKSDMLTSGRWPRGELICEPSYRRLLADTTTKLQSLMEKKYPKLRMNVKGHIPDAYYPRDSSSPSTSRQILAQITVAAPHSGCSCDPCTYATLVSALGAKLVLKQTDSKAADNDSELVKTVWKYAQPGTNLTEQQEKLLDSRKNAFDHRVCEYLRVRYIEARENDQGTTLRQDRETAFKDDVVRQKVQEAKKDLGAPVEGWPIDKVQ